ncbi:MAG: hypothetical protein JKY65_11370 [Planctomycetes bacterium]|nr:hypothetical protein [Planctomycetota bacterium]
MRGHLIDPTVDSHGRVVERSALHAGHKAAIEFALVVDPADLAAVGLPDL